MEVSLTEMEKIMEAEVLSGRIRSMALDILSLRCLLEVLVIVFKIMRRDENTRM